MELNQTLPNSGQYIALTICCRKVRFIPPYKIGVEKLLHLLGCRRLQNLMANIFGVKQDTDNRAKALESIRGPLHRPTFCELWSTNSLKLVWSFY